MPTIVPGARLTPTQVKVYASLAGWPADLHDELLVVSHCESKNRPYATNGVMRGLMQVAPIWFDYSATPHSYWADPITNLRVAYSAYRYDLIRGNPAWTQWQCKPDGTVAPAPPPAPELVLEAGNGATGASNQPPAAEATEDSTPTPPATPAPWDKKPAWPPSPGSDSDTRALISSRQGTPGVPSSSSARCRRR
jgi:hypothetical protein